MAACLCCFMWIAFALAAKSSEIKIKTSGWTVQPYTLPQLLVGGEAAAILASNGNIYYFGGLFVNILEDDQREYTQIDEVARLPVLRKPSRFRSRDNVGFEIIGELSVSDGFLEPHFVSGNNALLLESEPDYVFLTCEDSMGGQIWRFDIRTFQFDIIAIMPIPLEDCCPVSVGDKIYIFGGDDNSRLHNITQIYNYETDQWTFGPEIPIYTGLELNNCENVDDRYIYLFGGQTFDIDTSANLNSYKYDIFNDNWQIIPNVFIESPTLSDGVLFQGVSYIPNTPYLLLTGGNNLENNVFYNTVLIYDIDNDEIDWSLSNEIDDMNFNRGAAVYVVANERSNKRSKRSQRNTVSVYAIGGRRNYDEPNQYANTVEIIRFSISEKSKNRDGILE